MIAVIDRDRLTAYGLALLLRDWGYDSVIGISAPELYGRTEAMGRHIDAIVADDRVEGGTTGHAEAASLARLASRRIPTVVLVSGGAEGESEAELQSRGFASVAKPIEPNALRDLLRRMVTPRAAANDR
jgi:CheY-like chemotaxis protein